MPNDVHVVDAAGTSRQPLRPGREIDIIACQRGGPDAHPQIDRVFGVRWAFLPELGFPDHGFRPYRRVDGEQQWFLGDATIFLPRSGSWVELAEDAEARRPAMGPYFPTIVESNLGFLLPLLRLVDPRVQGDEDDRILAVAEFLGYAHLEDAELAFRLWPDSPPPPPRRAALEALLADAAARPWLVRFYRRRAVDFLLALAVRFPYAVLLGIGLDDVVKGGREVTYGVVGAWQLRRGEAETAVRSSNVPCDPAPPAGLNAERAPGSVPHPAFAHFTGWTPPPEILPDEVDAGAQPASLLVPRAPAHFTALRWDAPAWPAGRLLTYAPVLYLPERFAHGADTAGAQASPPSPPDAAFQPLEDGELIVRPETEPHYLDRPGMDWPPLEGWYRYRLWGVDLLGTRTRAVAEATVRHHDDLPPASPGVRLLGEEALEFRSGDPSPEVELEIIWDAAQDFMGPDVTEFRVASAWMPRIAVPVQVQQVSDVDTLKVEAEVAELPGDAAGYAGAHLTLPDGDYLISSAVPGSPGRLIVFRSAGRAPAPGESGVVFRMGETTSRTRVARVPRRPAVPARVTAVDSVEPLEVRLTAADPAVTLPADEPVRLYLHVLRASFVAEPVGAGRWRVVEPEPGDARLDALATWRGFNDPPATLNDSPAIVFPGHQAKVRVVPPAGFNAGLLLLYVTAADDADYVASPPLDGADASLENLTGNESAPAEAARSVRSLDPPGAPAADPWDPSRRLWATSAAIYAEEAEYELRWGAASGAAGYEVWRVLENAIADPQAAHGDEDLRTLAGANPGAFELRSLHVFAPVHRDRLPGRVPTRALYRVRAVSTAGVPGPWSDLIGPVYVPDVRRPPAPNLLSVGPPRAPAPDAAADDEEAQPFNEVPGAEPERPWPPPAVERALDLVWTQPGPTGGLRYEIEAYDAAHDEWEVIGRTGVDPVPQGATPEERALGRFGFRLEDVTPGRAVRYRVVAVRVAADPVDPTGQAVRDIRGAPAKDRPARASGPLRAPAELTAAYDPAAERTVLAWTNADVYEAVDVGRMRPGGYRFEWTSLNAGQGEVAVMDEPLAPGLWTFRVRARGFSRRAESADVTVEVT